MMAVTNDHPHNPVKEIRLALGLTQAQMAERLGCSKMTERRCEYNATLPQTRAVLDRLHALAREAGISIDTE